LAALSLARSGNALQTEPVYSNALNV